MKFSELWLREWLNTAMHSEILVNQITMAGLEVEDINPVASAFHGVVVGKIVKCSRYSNANNLQLTKVDIGSKQLINIICDAPNCRSGLKVAVATVGAVLPNNFKIKSKKLQSELSEGILCSYSTLGISDECRYIIELPIDAPIGSNIRDYMKLDDNIIKIRVTPNRADCLSIIGVARDLALLNNTELKVPNIIPVEATISDTLMTQIEVIDACPRYLSRVVRNINVKALTPLWMKEKLRRSGVRSINVVVDITNYVLLELGQPMHAFDKDRIDGGIVVRMAKEGETLLLLDDREVKLNGDTLLIADYVKALAIGGIFGGKRSGINDRTQNVLLECAFFYPFSIIGRAQRYGLCTNASYRYERGVDPGFQHKAMERATRLLIDICGGEPGPVIDVANKSTLPKCTAITLRRSKLDHLIGHHIDDMQVSDILQRLGCDVTKDRDQWQIVVPSWRFDMKIEEDLIKEVVRIYGYNNIPNKPVQSKLIMRSHREAELSLDRVKTLLNDRGYQEVITYSFVDPNIQKLIHPDKKALILSNPISHEMSAMRLSLWTGLLGTIIYNQRRQLSRVRIFETGLCFVPDAQGGPDIRQDLMVAGAICGNLYEEHWDLPRNYVDFYDLKGDVESVLDLTGKLSEIEFRLETIAALHPMQSAAIYMKNERIGFIGVVHPELERKLDLYGRTIVFELEWNKITNRVVPQAHDVSRFPANRRDIAIIVVENIPAAAILAECKKVVINQTVDVNLFDVYRGKGIAKGFKSLAISLIFQDIDRTLEAEEIAATVTKCVEALKERFQVSLRD